MRDDEGDDALAELYVGVYPRLLAQAYAISGSRAEAEDAVQEAFTRALLRPGTMRRLDSPEAWLRTVMLNVLRSRWRRARRWAGLAPRLVQETSGEGLSPDRVALVTALAQLPQSQREAVVLHHIGDLSVRDIAAALNVPEGTVKARLSRGRTALAALLGGDDETVEEVDHRAR